MSDKLFGKRWGMEVGLSAFSGGLRPNNETRVYEPVGDGYKLTVSGTRNGQVYEWGYTAKYDGKDHPVHGRPDADAIEAYRVNDNITIGTFKKNGKIVAFYRRGVSFDGTSLTVEMGGREVDGSAYYNVIEYKAPAT